MSTAAGKGRVKVEAIGVNGNSQRSPVKDFEVEWKAGKCEVAYALGNTAKLWDEHAPNLYELHVDFSESGTKAVQSTQVTFGLRELGQRDRMFTMNGKTTQLRGTLDNAIWPLTGFPATDVASWRKEMQACKDFGLNHIRFHSWCPPEAAFIAADQLGLYLHVENSIWSHKIGEDTGLQQWVLNEEAPAILAAYGNHPSFFGMGIGNEGKPSEARAVFARTFVEKCKQLDNRHFYTDFTHTGIEDTVDYEVKAAFIRDGKNHLIRGGGAIASTLGDFSADMELMEKTTIGHETVQQAVYPDLREMDLYTGALKPTNYEIFRDFAKANGMGGFEEEVFLSAGKFQTLLYKGDIEVALRSRHYAGYEMLGINDFSGQGTALVGALNVFWEPKRYTSAAEYTRFENTVVPLARFSKRVWTKNETLTADLQVAHYGPEDFRDQAVSWTLKTASGKQVAGAVLDKQTIAQGGLRDLGKISAPLGNVPTPCKLTLEVALVGTKFVNSWDFWVYDQAQPAAGPESVLEADTISKAVIEKLHSGGTVCLFVDPKKISGVEGKFSFQPFGWNLLTFPQQKNMGKGLLANPAHPALAQFPTDSFADWQWQDLMDRCQPVDLSKAFPPNARGIVQLIDTWTKCRKLGVIFEAQVDGGSLLFCSFDLQGNLENRPAAAQLRKSLLAYAGSAKFKPEVKVSLKDFSALLYGKVNGTLAQIGGRIVSVSSEQTRREAKYMIDGDRATYWHSQFTEPKQPLPQSVVLELPKILPLDGLSYLPRQEAPQGHIKEYAIYLSNDGKTWGQPVLKGKIDPASNALANLKFAKKTEGRFVKLEILSGNADVASIAELDILFDVDQAIQAGIIDPSGFNLQ